MPLRVPPPVDAADAECLLLRGQSYQLRHEHAGPGSEPANRPAKHVQEEGEGEALRPPAADVFLS
ncbi:MAG TPA: hypothetical protein VE758_06480 [Chthoniobacterales bacterium]|nr:hypothetical protein [Chthoniobacterales bacterium]